MKWVITINKLNKPYLIFFCKNLCTFWFDNLCQIIYWYRCIFAQFVLRFVRIYCVICGTKTTKLAFKICIYLILFWLLYLVSFYNLRFKFLIIPMVSSTSTHPSWVLENSWKAFKMCPFQSLNGQLIIGYIDSIKPQYLTSWTLRGLFQAKDAWNISSFRIYRIWTAIGRITVPQTYGRKSNLFLNTLDTSIINRNVRWIKDKLVNRKTCFS